MMEEGANPNDAINDAIYHDDEKVIDYIFSNYEPEGLKVEKYILEQLIVSGKTSLLKYVLNNTSHLDNLTILELTVIAKRWKREKFLKFLEDDYIEYLEF